MSILAGQEAPLLPDGFLRAFCLHLHVLWSTILKRKKNKRLQQHVQLRRHMGKIMPPLHQSKAFGSVCSLNVRIISKLCAPVLEMNC